jgi:hypothetical protein
MQRAQWLTVLRVAAILAVILLLLASPSSEYVLKPQSGAGPLVLPQASRFAWLILAVPLIAHGLAHLSGLLAPFTRRDLGFAEQPWAFAHGITLHSAVGRACGLLWLAAALGLVGSGLGLLLGQIWWAAVAFAAALLSLIVILIWWKAVPLGARVGAAFDLAILLAASQLVQPLMTELTK